MIKKIFKNFSLTIISNLSTTLISIMVIFIVPKIIGKYEYGLFQIFLFYISYAGLIQFGWLDGIYLRYGGEYYQNLDVARFKGQFILYLLSQFFVVCLIALIVIFSVNINYYFIVFSLVFGVLITNLKTFYQFILQLTNRIPEFVISNLIASFVYVALMLFGILIKQGNYQLFIVSNVMGQVFAMLYVFYVCRNLLFTRKKALYELKEVFNNIYVGIKISFASLAAMLVLGIVRMGIQTQWSIETFGQVSLVLSVCNLLMVFINAASLVIYPFLKRLKSVNMVVVYKSVESLVMPVLLALLLIYYPLNLVINAWLPNYSHAIVYMSYLFPIGLYQGKFEILTNTFFKAWRMENQLLMSNCVALVSSAVLTYITAFLLHDLDLTVLTVMIALIIRCLISEIYVKKVIKNSSAMSFLSETIMVVLFMLINMSSNIYLSGIAYFIIVLIYLLLNKGKILKATHELTKLN